MVMFSHSVFSASFAVAASFFASRGIPPAAPFFWIMTAFLGARTFANAFNRIADREIDRENPRTRERHLPAGEISVKEAWVIAALSLALFFTGAAMLPPLCFLLSPAAAVLLFAYSYTKRFTWLCHFFLGAVCAAASFGGWLGITGYFEWQILPLAAANGAWVAGFDIVYAVQDMEHDRRKKLYSIPARFGKRASFVLAVFLHIFSFLLLAAQGVIMGSGIIYFTGVAVIGALFIYQHAHTLRTAFGSVNYAVYSVNKAVALVLLAAVVIDEFAAFLLR
jgi:4-hydroxybenzoate polyprenyltransferase